jgi:hypothetical protein
MSSSTTLRLVTTGVVRGPCPTPYPIRCRPCAQSYGPGSDNVYHGQPIPIGYAKVGVVEVCQDYEMLELDIPGGDGETTLAQAIHG